MFITVETEAGTIIPVVLIILGSVLVLISAAMRMSSREAKPKTGTE
jgi:hypothetical protein